MKILLAVDGSAYTKKMLAYLTTHEEMFGSHNEITLFTVQAPLPRGPAPPWVPKWPTATTPKKRPR